MPIFIANEGDDFEVRYDSRAYNSKSVTALKVDGKSGLVTGPNGQPVGKTYQFLTTLGHNNTGAVTFAGAAVGDVVKSVTSITGGVLVDASAVFEAVISVAGQIQQLSSADKSAVGYQIVTERG
jgi:hypothetical protein